VDPTLTDTIDMHGDPLAFRLRQGRDGARLVDRGGRDVLKVEARQMAGHQKEAVVTQGISAAPTLRRFRSAISTPAFRATCTAGFGILPRSATSRWRRWRSGS
jgi:hypothetical protein